VQWPAGIGAKGNEGVANNVAQTKGSIGYVEYAYAKQNKLTYTKMVNKAARPWRRPRGLPGRGGQRRLEEPAGLRRDPRQPAGRPVVADDRGDLDPALQEAGRSAATGEALKFFAWSYAKGADMAKDLDYVPMPANVVGDIQKMWAPRSRTRAASRCSPDALTS
jgi:phosphate transport system substrate-binding protein